MSPPACGTWRRLVHEGVVLKPTQQATGSLSQLTRPRRGIFGWPRRRAGVGDIAVLGVPYDGGNVVAPGARQGPGALRSASAKLGVPRACGIDLGDLRLGDLEPRAVHDRLGCAMEAILSQAYWPLVLGGDHSISYPVIERLQENADLGVVWFDAHTDFTPWMGSGTHNHKEVLRRIHHLRGVRRIVQVGYRGYTLEDELRLADRVHVLRPGDLRHRGLELLLDYLPADLRYYVSIDIDVIDPAWAPGTGTPVPGGFSPEEVMALAGGVLGSRMVMGLDLAEVNPAYDHGSRTSLLACRLLHAILDSRSSALPESVQTS